MLGSALSLYGDTLAVGGGGGGFNGQVYVFVRTDTTWSLQSDIKTLLALDGSQMLGFGLSLYADTLAVGELRSNFRRQEFVVVGAEGLAQFALIFVVSDIHLDFRREEPASCCVPATHQGPERIGPAPPIIFRSGVP